MSTLPEHTDSPRAEFLASLRLLIDWLQAHPDVPQPYHLLGDKLYIYVYGEDPRAVLARIARAMGNADKDVDEARFELRRRFGAITLVASARRDEVCERVVVGTREVTRRAPDPHALAALPVVTVTEIVEDVQWVCPPSLLNPDAPSSAQSMAGAGAAPGSAAESPPPRVSAAEAVPAVGVAGTAAGTPPTSTLDGVL